MFNIDGIVKALQSDQALQKNLMNGAAGMAAGMLLSGGGLGKMVGNVAKAGAVAAVGGLAWSAWQNYQKNQPGPARWQIHSYNLETETFAYVTEFTTPDMDETRVQFGAIFEDRLYFTYDDRYLYVFDAGENTVTQLFDFKELSNEPGFDGAYGFRIDPTEEGALFFNRMGLNRYN